MVKVNWTGSGWEKVDGTARYGSAGRLLGISQLDVLRRGWFSNLFVHELLHQWGAYLSWPFDFGITDGAHYLPNTSAASLLGGKTWVPNADGTFTLDCNGDSRFSAKSAAPLDLYLMGLIDASAVPPLRQYSSTSFDEICGNVIPNSAIQRTVTIEEIQNRLGVRVPGPAGAQRAFHIAFIMEADGRDLSDSEFTYFNLLAEFATRTIPEGQANPTQRANDSQRPNPASARAKGIVFEDTRVRPSLTDLGTHANAVASIPARPIAIAPACSISGTICSCWKTISPHTAMKIAWLRSGNGLVRRVRNSSAWRQLSSVAWKTPMVTDGPISLGFSRTDSPAH